MSRTYIFAADIFKNKTFLREAIISAEDNGKVSELTEKPGKNKEYSCTLTKGGNQINLVLQAERITGGEKKKITQSAVSQMSDPNLHEKMQEKAKILREEIGKLSLDQEALIAEQKEVRKEYDKKKQEYKKKRDFDSLIREEGLQVLKTVKKRLSDKISSYKSSIMLTSNSPM